MKKTDTLNLVVFIFTTCILPEQRHVNVIIAKKSKAKHYDMGCECGKREVDVRAEEDCELSAKLEGATGTDKNQRIVGGCKAGHTPWYEVTFLNSRAERLRVLKRLKTDHTKYLKHNLSVHNITFLV